MLAISVTALAILVIPIMVTLATGLFGFVLAASLTVMLFNADPPIMGMALGLVLLAGVALGVVAVVVALIVITLIGVILVVLPTTLLVRRVLSKLGVRSTLGYVAAYLCTGAAVGTVFAVTTGVIASVAGLKVNQHIWALALGLLLSALLGALSVSVCGTVLESADQARPILSRFLGKKFDPSAGIETA